MNIKLVATPSDDSPILSRLPWLTPRRLIGFVIGWLTLFAILSAFISNPFQSEASASSGPDYAHVMFLHGLLIGMVGLMALLMLQVFAICARHCRLGIAGGVVAATVLASIGGIWDKTIPGSEVPMWTQILGFFALDEILLLLILGLVMEWRRGSALSRTFTFIAGALASFAMLVAAVMGHLAGWLMEFGYVPSLLGNFASKLGFGKIDDFTGALVGSHSHEMAVGAMALAAVILAQQFGYATLTGAARFVSRTGIAMIAIGTAVMTLLYVVMGFTTWSVPTMFESANGGIPGDDIVTGILVMGGGVVVGAAFLITLTRRMVVRLAAIWAWVLSFATVVVAGYTIELNTNYFGAGDPKAAGAAKDAIFTWLHQDVGLFLLPTLVVIMLAVDRLVVRRGLPSLIGFATIFGTSVLFVGGMIWSFVDPTLFGPGYILSTIGLLAVGAAILATIYWGVLEAATPDNLVLPAKGVTALDLPVVARPQTPATTPKEVEAR